MANVSVTPINMGDQHQHQQSTHMVAVTNSCNTTAKCTISNAGSITVHNAAITSPEDAEVANIIQQQQLRHDVDVTAASTVTVALRSKGTKQQQLQIPSVMTSHVQLPRPMSWEGELSSDENRSNDVSIMAMDEDSSNDAMTCGSGTSSLNPIEHPVEQQQQLQITLNQPEHLSTVMLQPQSSTNETINNNSGSGKVQQIQGTDTGGSGGSGGSGGTITKPPSPIASNHSPLQNHHRCCLPPLQLSSPDSAIHSSNTTCYSVFSSPAQSPLTQRHLSALMSTAAATTTTPNLSRNNSDASHSSCCSYSSVSVSECNLSSSSPTHSTGSPIQVRHCLRNSNLLVYQQDLQIDAPQPAAASIDACASPTAGAGIQPGISRQQLINSPCPICGDKISGFHYGIFSCESCKGFFKRTVQNRKNYVCLRGAVCPVTVATRKKCPACRFEKCLQCGMKLEAIREDRTRGGRSTYQCSYSLPPSMLSMTHTSLGGSTATSEHSVKQECGVGGTALNTQQQQIVNILGQHTQHPQQICLGRQQRFASRSMSSLVGVQIGVPPLLQEIMDVEHLWHYSELELHRLSTSDGNGGATNASTTHCLATHPLLAGTALGMTDTNPDFVANLCNIADHRLYKIVKWCKSLPLFKNISIDDQILLLINSWCELLLFSCCYRSMSTPGEIRVSLGKRITLAQARDMGPTSSACIERMLNFTEQLRRLRVDRYEYVAMKVIVLLTSDTNQSDLSEAEKVRVSQEKALKALQDYTLTHYPDSPAKFGELLLRIPELQRTCQVGKEMLTIKSKDGDGPSFNLLMELLRGDH